MKKLILTAIFFISINIYSQDFESIKKLDTVYVTYKGLKNEEKTIFKEKNSFPQRSYIYYIKNSKNETKTIIFYFNAYKDWQHKNAGLTSDIRKVKKSFIKKNKTKIIGMDFFENNDVCKVGFEILTQLKVFYIIDATEKKDGKITLYEVTVSDVCFRGE